MVAGTNYLLDARFVPNGGIASAEKCGTRVMCLMLKVFKPLPQDCDHLKKTEGKRGKCFEVIVLLRIASDQKMDSIL